ncbi:hypothetical protein, partial [Desulfocucumis palustris]|uniref:hypothetical protein n=1 Tax=Desulfocucumis palustris TaxID=1898651 RepID=UPI0013FDF94F
IPVRQIALRPLDRSQTGRFIADALRCPEEKTIPLAEILYRKSGGNPFFLGQLLKTVYDEKLLLLNTRDHCWEWEPESVQKLQMADDVVDLLLGKLQKLPEEA